MSRRLGDIDQLQAAATEVAGDAVGLDEPHHDALRGELRFLLAAKDLDRHAASLLAAGMNSGPSSASRTAAVAMARSRLDLERAGDSLEACQCG